MNKLRLRILYLDTEDTQWYQAVNCAITKALVRAGKGDWQHTGLHIRQGMKIVVNEDNPNLQDLARRVANMYYPQGLRKRTIKNFNFTLRW